MPSGGNLKSQQGRASIPSLVTDTTDSSPGNKPVYIKYLLTVMFLLHFSRTSYPNMKLCIHVSVYKIKSVALFISQMCEILLKLAEMPETRNKTHTFVF